MFSPEYYPALPDASVDVILEEEWRRLANHFGLQALMLVKVDVDSEAFRVVSSFNLTLAPFNGSEKRFVADVINNCFTTFPKHHVHAIGHFALANLIRRYSHSESGIVKAWFYPLQFEGSRFVFLGFPQHDCKLKTIPEEFTALLPRVLFTISATSRFHEILTRITVMELFVKEVGHDIASSVQATTATLRNISQGRITGAAILKKAREVENEIMGAYRVAENLGIVVDPNYQMQEAAEFDLIDTLNTAIDHHRSEAEERQNNLLLNSNIKSIPLWGDRNAIEVALGHLLLNAVKYSFDSSYITITISFDGENVVVRISNKGIRLPSGEEYHNIWDFGVRGTEAKERHVNGSGIGLYTVRKILQAHMGSVSAESDKGDCHISYFYVTMPTMEMMKRKLFKAAR